jgi:hypothetical protein
MKRNRCSGVGVEAGGESLISSAGAALLLKSAQVSGLTGELSRVLRPWRALRSIHDPGKTVLDVAVTIALGGDCLADAAVVRAQPELFGAVASDPTISRLIDSLGEDSEAAIAAIRAARAAARTTVWGHRVPVPVTGPVVVDLDATLIGAHSEKEGATRTSNAASGFIRCWPSSITVPGALESPLPACCVPGGPMPIPPPTRSRFSTLRWPSCLHECVTECWCAATLARACSPYCGTFTPWGWPTRWA